MIVLQDQDLFIRVDPAHGAEVLDLVDLASGRQLLARTPWSTAPPPGGDLDEDTWIASYRGGWQLLTPNAGNVCEVDGTRHGFHGRASADPWEVEACSPTSATLTWEGHGLAVRRTLTLEDGALRLDTELRGARDVPVPLIAVEHVAVGVELLDPQTELSLPSARAYELDETGGPARPPADATAWPEIRLLDGGVERGDLLTLRTPRCRMIALAELAHGWAAVRNPRDGQGLALSWDATWFPHMWLWHETRTIGDVWREMTELLVVEPSTVPHHMGLAAAIESGDARWLAPGETARTWIVVRPFRTDTPVREVTADARVR